MAINHDRNTAQRMGDRFAYPAAAGAVIHAGTIVCLNAGRAVPGAANAALVAVGIADGPVSNADGADDAVRVDVKLGTFLLANAAADQITAADVGADCYVLDNETVARTNGGAARPRAGRIRQVDAAGVWVTFA